MKILIPALNDKIDNYLNACKYIGIEATITNKLCDVHNFDGLLLPGGSDLNPKLYGEENKGSVEICDDRDKLQLDVLDAFINLHKPVFGTCRGHQLINVYFRGTLHQDIKGHRIENEGLHVVNVDKASPYYGILSDKIMVNSTHHQCVDKVGVGLNIFALSEDGIIEGLYNTDKNILSVQWHPERLIEKGGEKIYYLFKNMLMQ